jgi:putative FmdB family regulatory protein
MPIYEYRCSKCSKTFEKLQKFSDAMLTECECGEQGQVERLVSSPAFHLKGGGWYKDGYGGAKPAANGDTTKTESKPSEAKTETKADSKPAATESKPATPAPATPSKDK